MTVHSSSAAPPSAVRTSFLLWMVDIVLSLVSVVLLVLGGEELMMMVGGPPAETDPAFQQGATISLIVGVVFALAVIAVELLCVFKMRAGRNWARIVLAVVAGLSVVLGLVSLGETVAMLTAGGLAAAVGVISLIGIPLLAAAVVFMYLPAARAWFVPSAPTG